MGIFKGSSRRKREALERLSLVGHDVNRDVEALVRLKKQVENDEGRLEELDQVNGSDKLDEGLIEDCYDELGERFVAPKVQGISEINQVLTAKKPEIEYEITDWSGTRVEKVDLREPGKLKAAFKAAYGVGTEAVGEAKFLNDFGVAKADMEAFFGLKGGASADVEYDWGKLAAKVGAELFAGAEFSCSGEVKVGSAENNIDVKVSGNAQVGVALAGSGSLSVTPTQAKAVLELAAFAGAKVKADGKFTGNIFGRPLFAQTVKATASAGIGADFSAQVAVGVEEIGFGFEASVTVGVGAGAGSTTTVNVTNVAMTLIEAKDRISHAQAYLDGYRSLNIQEREWEKKIERLKKAYARRIALANNEIERMESYIG